MSAVVRGDALRLPLADESVDLIVTSPPYFALRSYRDDGEHYSGQIGSEATPRAFLEALWAVTAECVRVLKPSGNMFVNLGDKYSGAGGPGGDYDKGGLRDGQPRYGAADYWRKMSPANNGIPAKSLMGIPWRYAIGCIDRLGLILRAEMVWSKPNGLPESVTDRVRRSHETWFHLTREPRYFSAVDEIRETYSERVEDRQTYAGREGVPLSKDRGDRGDSNPARGILGFGHRGANPLGKLPGSVWTIPSEPLVVPDWLGVDHFAAFPQEWPRRLILGWSPSGICVECGEGRRPVVDAGSYPPEAFSKNSREDAKGNTSTVSALRVPGSRRSLREPGQFLGYECQCGTEATGATRATTDGGGWGESGHARPDRPSDGDDRLAGNIRDDSQGSAGPGALPPTRPAVVLDPFGGTGTTAMVARALGRTGVSVDLSADYCRLASWRIFESGHARKAIARTNRENQGALL